MDTQAIVHALADHARLTGLFESVNLHEPVHPPGTGVVAAVWAGPIRPVPSESGLAATTARVEYRLRLYKPMTAPGLDAIDPAMTKAVDVLFLAYHGDFSLDDVNEDAEIDLLGRTGTALSAVDGYQNHNNVEYRVYTITVPVIVQNAWPQGAQ